MLKVFKKIFFWVFLVLFILLIAIAGASIGILSSLARSLPDVNQLHNYEPSEATRIYANDGTFIGSLFKENRTWVNLSNVPQVMKQAIIAIEDSRFYYHRGVDFKGIARATREDLMGGEVTQGASTITQQLARNIFLSPRHTLERKIKEVMLAIQIERKFSKDEILEYYLNQIYFGAGAYGIEAAAQTYFGKPASKLQLAEAALLAGLPAAPSVYSPFNDFKLAKRRQYLVLQRMTELGMITPQEAKDAYALVIKFYKPKEVFQSLLYPYFTTYVLHELQNKYKEDLLYRGGLQVYTTLDVKMQDNAQNMLDQSIQRGLREGMNSHQGALVTLEPNTGFIRAMAGGAQFSTQDQFNRAWQAKRQPGSAFKVFVYTAAIDSGFSPESTIEDSPKSYPMGDGSIWTPKNSDGKFWGTLTFRYALKMSRNVCAVRLIEYLGPDKVVRYAYRMGISDQLEPILSLALGSSVVTPLEMASAFGVLANRGIRVAPTAIKVVKDSDGRIIEDHSHPYQEEVLPQDTADTMVDMLKDVIQSGTGTVARLSDREAAGKTGTTDEHRDTWFIGFTPQLATAVWMGNDDYSKMNYAFGGYLPAMTWHNFMTAALKGKPVIAFAKPATKKLTVKKIPAEGKEAKPEPSPGEETTAVDEETPVEDDTSTVETDTGSDTDSGVHIIEASPSAAPGTETSTPAPESTPAPAAPEVKTTDGKEYVPLVPVTPKKP